MSGSPRHWFHVASALAEIQRLCKRARKEEVRARKARKRKERKAGGEEAGLPAPPETGEAGADLVALRAKLRASLTRLKGKLADTLPEHEVYHALFPLVVYADELAQSATQERVGLFRPLQREFYEVDNGGERFYSIADTLLRREDTSPLVFEVFYLCLSAGFRGQYASAPDKLEEYKARLAARIPTPKPPQEEGGPRALAAVELVAFPTWYYVAAAAAVLAVFAALHLATLFEALPAR